MTDTKTPPIEDEFGADRAVFLPKWPTGKDGSFSKTFIGTVLAADTVHDVAGLGGEPRDVDLYTVVDDDGERFTIWGSGMLARVLPAHISHRVRIEDQGLTKRDDQTQLRTFDVRCATCTSEGR